MVTPGNGMKWQIVEPTQGVYDWSQADELVNFAHANRQLIRGHTLTWYNQLPDWLTTGVANGSSLTRSGGRTRPTRTPCCSTTTTTSAARTGRTPKAMPSTHTSSSYSPTAERDGTGWNALIMKVR